MIMTMGTEMSARALVRNVSSAGFSRSPVVGDVKLFSSKSHERFLELLVLDGKHLLTEIFANFVLQLIVHNITGMKMNSAIEKVIKQETFSFHFLLLNIHQQIISKQRIDWFSFTSRCRTNLASNMLFPFPDGPVTNIRGCLFSTSFLVPNQSHCNSF